jgi:hypothetical protein
MHLNELNHLEENPGSLPPRSEVHGSKRKAMKESKKSPEEKHTESDSGFNFQLVFINILVLLFFAMIVVTVIYPNWLQKL